jgi:hypothetical protein
MFDFKSYIIISSEYYKIPNIEIRYDKHSNPEVKTNIYMKISHGDNAISINLNPEAAMRWIATFR